MRRYNYKDMGEKINLGTVEDIKIKDLALIIKDIVGFEGDIKYDLSKPDETPSNLQDTLKIKELGWKPKIILNEGIRKSYETYLSNNFC
jgi:GDP-L-fucose synthase